MRSAIITGSNGQDGSYLTAHLTQLGYRIIGIDRGPSMLDLTDTAAVFDLVRTTAPNEVYHLAAHHHSAQESQADELSTYRQSHDVHVIATANLLEGLRRFQPVGRLFYAASCHLFGATPTTVQDETTPFLTDHSLYAITKRAGVDLCRYYRHQHHLFAAVGILYNHESPRRGAQFVSQKIAQAAAAIARGGQQRLALGNLDAAIDWGFAGDYVTAMRQILQLTTPDDFIISSGETHTVRDFVVEAFACVGLDWQAHVVVDPGLLRTPRQIPLVGNHAKLSRLTGWQPTTSFRDLVREMVTSAREQHGHA